MCTSCSRVLLVRNHHVPTPMTARPTSTSSTIPAIAPPLRPPPDGGCTTPNGARAHAQEGNTACTLFLIHSHCWYTILTTQAHTIHALNVFRFTLHTLSHRGRPGTPGKRKRPKCMGNRHARTIGALQHHSFGAPQYHLFGSPQYVLFGAALHHLFGALWYHLLMDGITTLLGSHTQGLAQSSGASSPQEES